MTRWAPAWTASPQPVWSSDFIFPADVPTELVDVTIRQVVRLGYAGRKIRLLLSNRYGTHAVRLAGVSIAPSLGGALSDAPRARSVSFSGKPQVTIPPGAIVASDAIDLSVDAGDDLAVSIHLRHPLSIGDFHWDGRRTGYLLTGDQLTAETPVIRSTTERRLFLAGILAETSAPTATIVLFGDSITDGAGASLDAEARWPDFLALRAAPRGIAIVNAGISGARLLGDRMGANALARFDQDVLAQPGVRAVIILLGINDIAWPSTVFAQDEPAMTLERLVTGYRALIERAHAANLRVLGVTLTPFADALPDTPMAGTYWSPAKDVLRRQANDWIRSSDAFDAVIDFDRLLGDPDRPGHLMPRFDSGDHLHPGDEGNRAMAAAIDLETLVPPAA